jgi:hypothetical protein
MTELIAEPQIGIGNRIDSFLKEMTKQKACADKKTPTRPGWRFA